MEVLVNIVSQIVNAVLILKIEGQAQRAHMLTQQSGFDRIKVVECSCRENHVKSQIGKINRSLCANAIGGPGDQGDGLVTHVDSILCWIIGFSRFQFSLPL